MNQRESPIPPTIGRIVLVRGPISEYGPKGQEYPAIVTKVHNENCINANVFNDWDGGVAVGSIVFNSDTSKEQIQAPAWRWMDYQVQAAAKAAALPETVAPTVLERVTDEAIELQSKFEALTVFFTTDTYKGLSPSHRELLDIQHGAMSSYLNVLRKRQTMLAAGG